MLKRKVILYAEDNENDVIFMDLALRRVAPQVGLQIVCDGREAIAYCQGESPYSDRTKFPVPDIILLDLKMPRVNGFEVLQWIRSESEWRHIPVVMLTASLEHKDQEKCYGLGANSFLVKPNQIDELVSLMGSVTQYWLNWNRSAHTEGPPPTARM